MSAKIGEVGVGSNADNCGLVKDLVESASY